VRIEKFDGSDFGFWKMHIEDYLYQKKLYLSLTRQKPTDMDQSKWDLLDRQTLGMIQLTLAKNVAFNIMNENTTVDLMKVLSNMYEKPSAANKVYLIRRLVNLKMGEGNSITNHISEFNTIIAQLTSVSESIPNHEYSFFCSFLNETRLPRTFAMKTFNTRTILHSFESVLTIGSGSDTTC